MLIFAIISTAGLTYLAYAITRSALFPPVVFSGTWLISLVGLALFGHLFYPISGESYLVYIAGAASFTAGSVLGLLATVRSEGHLSTHRNVDKTPRDTLIALDIALIVVIAAIPLYWYQASATAEDLPLALQLQHIRFVEVQATGARHTFGVVGNLVVLAQIVAVAIFYEDDKSAARRLRTLVAIAVAFTYGAMSATKGTPVALLLTLFFVSAMKTSEMKIKTILVTLAGSLALFAAGLLLVNYAYASLASVPEAISILAKTLANYWLGNLVAFDLSMPKLNSMESTQTVARFFFDTAASLGMNISAPSANAVFTQISPDMDTNTYTIYFSYFKDFGWLGMCVLLGLLGAVLTLIYRRANRRRPLSLMMYSMLSTGLVFSFRAEQLLLGLNGYIKAALFLFFLYRLIPALGRQSDRRVTSGA